jgi:hypothetical protein
MARKPYQCSRCGCLGHNAATCSAEKPRPKPKKRTRKNQCQHCKGLGHNVQNCTNAPDEFYVPPTVLTVEERAMKREERWLKGVQDRYPGLVEQIGTVFDARIAEQYGLSRERIRQIRNRLGHSRFEARPPLLTDEEVLLLGAMPDAECGERLGLHPCAVQRERLRRGILSHAAANRKERDTLIGSVQHLLGKTPDPQIAAMLGHGLTVHNIYRYRVRHGIEGKQQGTRWAILDRSEITRLFKAGRSDTEIAQHLNANPGTVSQIRTSELGLYHHGPRRCSKCGQRGHNTTSCTD